MDIRYYMDKTADTAIYPNQGAYGGLSYTLFGLAGELGELFEVFKKALRDNGGNLDLDRIKKETGDVLWYFSQAMIECRSGFEDEEDVDEFQKLLYDIYLSGKEKPQLEDPDLLFLQTNLLTHVHRTLSKVFERYNTIHIENTGETEFTGLSKEISTLLIDILKIIGIFLGNFNITFSEVMQMNLDKLSERKKEGKLQGSGEEISDR